MMINLHLLPPFIGGPLELVDYYSAARCSVSIPEQYGTSVADIKRNVRANFPAFQFRILLNTVCCELSILLSIFRVIKRPGER